MTDKNNKKKKDHTKSGLKKIFGAAVTVGGIIITILTQKSKNN